MAVEKRNTLGEITGMLGNIVRRKRHGKIIVSLRPARYRKSKSKQAVEGRNSFALSVAFAKAVNSIPQLKQVWQLAKLEGVVAYNRVIKYNKKFIKENSLTLNNITTPNGVALLLTDFKIVNKGVSLKIELKERELKRLLQNPFYLHLIIYAFNPVSSRMDSFVVTGQSKIIDQAPVNNSYTIDFKKDNITQKYFAQYKSFIIYAAATNFKGNKKEVFWTSTVSKLFNI